MRVLATLYALFALIITFAAQVLGGKPYMSAGVNLFAISPRQKLYLPIELIHFRIDIDKTEPNVQKKRKIVRLPANN